MTSGYMKLTSLSLVFLGVYLNIPFTILSFIFEYPQILREPTGDILTLFDTGGPLLIAAWYAFTFAAILMVVVVSLVYGALRSNDQILMGVATVFGVLAGLLQALGLIRWVFVVPGLAQAYTDPASTETTRSAAALIFNALHQYAGVAIGEHLGQLFTAVWVALVSISMLRTARLLGTTGLVIASAMALGLVEGFATVIRFNPGFFAILTPVAFVALSIWMISLGISMLRRPSLIEIPLERPLASSRSIA